MSEETVNTENANNEKLEREFPKFDWVSKRSTCSLPKIFKALLLQVEDDVKTRNSLRPANSPYEFSVEEKSTCFKVTLKSKGMEESVAFSLAEHAIIVRDGQDNLKFEVTLRFNDKGECKLHLEKEDKKLWQVRRRALERLMFAGN